MANVVNDPVFSRDKIVFTPLYIKLVLLKQFVKIFEYWWRMFSIYSFCFVCCVFPKKLKQTVDGPQIRSHVRDKDFIRNMNVNKAS